MGNKKCTLCGGRVRTDRHVDDGKFCSKKCEIDARKNDETNTLSFVAEGLNALCFKDFHKRNGRYPRILVIGDTQGRRHLFKTSQ